MMKTYNSIIASIVTLMFVLACDNDGYIDPISKVDPGPDETPPTVIISYPSEGAEIRVNEEVTSIEIQMGATDDIEIQSIVVDLDGNNIAEFTEFLDYRKANEVYTYNDLTNGPHMVTVTATDISGKSTSQSVSFEKIEPYQIKYEGEVFYMPFDGDYTELVSIVSGTKVGSPTFSDDAVAGTKSYVGAIGGYVTFPTSEIGLSSEFSAAFWYRLNALPDRSGILTIGPPDPNLPATPNNRKNGFRLFRENADGKQRIKLNVGNGTADNWFDGGAAADVAVGSDWVHIAFTISDSQCVVYINGVVVSQGAFTGVDWTGCDILSIASGAPRFTEWGHLSDVSLYDELRLFNKALTQEEIQAIIND